MAEAKLFRFASTDASGASNPADPVDRSDAQLVHLLNAEYHRPRYRFVRCLGFGGVGRGLACHDLLLGRDLAFKFVAADDLQAAAELRREQTALAALNHPAIPALIDSGAIDGGITWLSMPLLPGHNLEALLHDGDGPDNWRWVCSLLLPVAEALQHAHTAGWVHGDVAPGNILLSDDGQTHLVDWGSAARVGAQRSQRATPGYRRQGADSLAGTADDVYAFGQVLARLLRDCRRPPRALRQLQAACTGTRTPSMAAVSHDLRALLVNEALQLVREPLPRRQWRWLRRHPGPAVLLLLALLLISGLGHLQWQEWQRGLRAWQLVWQEDFEDPQLLHNWQSRMYPLWQQGNARELPVNGDQAVWFPQDGGMRNRWVEDWPGVVTLHRQLNVSGDVRLSWRFRMLAGEKNANAFMGEDRFSGWGLHLGGWNEPDSLILSDGRFTEKPRIVAIARLPQALAPGVTGHVQWLFVDGEHQVLLDGELRLRYRDPFASGGASLPWCGWEAAGSNWLLDEVRVEELHQSASIPAHRLPDYLYAQGQHREALQQYRRLPLTQLAARERSWVAIQIGACHLALGEAEQAREQWLGVTNNPQYETSWRGLAILRLLPLLEEQEIIALLQAVRPSQQVRLEAADRLLQAAWQQAWVRAPRRDALISGLRALGQHIHDVLMACDIDLAEIPPLRHPNTLQLWATYARRRLCLEEISDLADSMLPGLSARIRASTFRPRLATQLEDTGELPDVLDILGALDRITVATLPAPGSKLSLSQLDQLARLQHIKQSAASRLDDPQTIYWDHSAPQHLALKLAIDELARGDRLAARQALLRGLEHPLAARLPQLQALLRALLESDFPIQQHAADLDGTYPLPLVKGLQADLAGRPAQAQQAYRQVPTTKAYADIAPLLQRLLGSDQR